MESDEKYIMFIQTFMHAARKAGVAILRIYNSEDFNVQLKEDNSPLTLADTASHRAIKQTLREDHPSIPLLSEEGKHIPYKVRKHWNEYFCVDPLDGTKEFIKRNGEFTVNIALINNRKSVLGAIYLPCRDVFYFGGADTGSYKIDGFSNLHSDFNFSASACEQFVKLPCTHSNRSFTVVGSRSHMNDETERYIEELSLKYGDIEIVSAGSSLKFCLVAEGLADVYPRFAPTMEWDTAAGQAIVAGSGGIALRKNLQKPLEYNKKNLVNPSFVALNQTAFF